MAFHFRVKQRVPRMAHDFAGDFDVEEQNRAEAVALHSLVFIARDGSMAESELSDETEAAAGLSRQTENQGVGPLAAAGEKLDAHVAFQLAVELLACRVVVVERAALAHVAWQVGPPAAVSALSSQADGQHMRQRVLLPGAKDQGVKTLAERGPRTVAGTLSVP